MLIDEKLAIIWKKAHLSWEQKKYFMIKALQKDPTLNKRERFLKLQTYIEWETERKESKASIERLSSVIREQNSHLDRRNQMIDRCLQMVKQKDLEKESIAQALSVANTDLQRVNDQLVSHQVASLMIHGFHAMHHCS